MPSKMPHTSVRAERVVGTVPCASPCAAHLASRLDEELSKPPKMIRAAYGGFPCQQIPKKPMLLYRQLASRRRSLGQSIAGFARRSARTRSRCNRPERCEGFGYCTVPSGKAPNFLTPHPLPLTSQATWSFVVVSRLGIFVERHVHAMPPAACGAMADPAAPNPAPSLASGVGVCQRAVTGLYLAMILAVSDPSDWSKDVGLSLKTEIRYQFGGVIGKQQTCSERREIILCRAPNWRFRQQMPHWVG